MSIAQMANPHEPVQKRSKWGYKFYEWYQAGN